MTTEKTCCERRRVHVPFGVYHPGIARIIALTFEELRKHDEKCLTLDSSEWQNGYSLLDHHRRVAEVMRAISEIRAVNDSELALRTSAALMHDLGKLSPSCLVYRRDRRLTDDEKAEINKHPHFSAALVEKYDKVLRQEDKKFLLEVRKVVLHHHEPHKIKRKELRMIAWDLMLSDAYVACTEARERPSLSPKRSLECLPAIIRAKIPLFWRMVFAREISESMRIINILYCPR